MGGRQTDMYGKTETDRQSNRDRRTQIERNSQIETERQTMDRWMDRQAEIDGQKDRNGRTV